MKKIEQAPLVGAVVLPQQTERKKVRGALKIAGAVLMVSILVTGVGYENTKDIKITPLEIRSEAVPDALDGVTVIHLSDIHMDDKWGNSMSPELLGSLQERIDALGLSEEKLITVLTGDIVNKKTSLEMVAQYAEALSRFPGQKFFVWGNHDIMSKYRNNTRFLAIRKIIEDAGFVFAGEEEETIQWSDGEELSVIGTPSFQKQRGRFDKDFYKKLTTQVQEKTALILAHNMDGMMPVLEHLDGDVVFSGHTHGEQVKVFPRFMQNKIVLDWMLRGYKSPHTEGLKQINENSWAEISRGIGSNKLWIVPALRIGTRPEVPIVTFQKEK